VPEINHLIESGTEKIVGDHQNFPQFLSGFHGYYFNFSGICWGEFPAQTFCLCALPNFCRADYDNTVLKQTEASGVTVTNPTAEQRAAFVQTTRPVYDKWTKTIGVDLVKKAETTIAKR